MQEKLFIMGSVLVFATGLIYFIIGLLLGRNERKKWKVSPFLGLAIGTAIAIWLLYLNGNRDAASGWFEQLMMSILGTIRTVTGENSVWDTREQVFEIAPEMSPLFSFYTAALHISTSSVVIGAILKLVDVLFPMVRYMLFSRNMLYVFSSLSERGILLAEDIRKENRKATLVFLKNQDGIKDESKVNRVHEISAYVFPYDVKELWKPFFIKEEKIEYFLLKDNHDENVNEALSLTEKHKEKNVRIHILSDSKETVDLIDTAAKNSKSILRLIDEAKLMAYGILDRVPLFLTKKEASDILIIGAGKNGQAAIKACSWCSCYNLESKSKIWVIDKEVTPKHRLEKEAPEMMSERNVHYEVMDVEDVEFVQFLREHRSIGYVICALGDDHLNLRTAMEVRGVSYEVEPFDGKEEKLPYIHVLLNDEFLSKTARKLAFKVGKDAGGKRSYELMPYGELKEFYTWENICASKLEGYGLAVDFHYAREAEREDALKMQSKGEQEKKELTSQEYYDSNYNTSNYNRDSSIACGLHAKYKLYALLEKASDLKHLKPIDWKKDIDAAVRKEIAAYLADEKNKDDLEELAKVEHLRWNAYTRSEGWCTPENKFEPEWQEESKLNEHRNFAAKQHQCLVSWDELKKLNVKRDGKMQDFQAYDRILVKETCSILENAEVYRENLLEEMKK